MQNKKAYWLGYFFPTLALLGLVFVFGFKPAYERAMALNAPVQESVVPVPAVVPDPPVSAPVQPVAAPVPAVAPTPAPAKPAESKPEPVLLPGAGASVYLGGASSCADLRRLRQAINPTPRGTQYKGQLLIANGTGERLRPCTSERSFSNTGQPVSTGKLKPGTYQLANGTLTIHSRR